jgi:hypothetical protein
LSSLDSLDIDVAGVFTDWLGRSRATIATMGGVRKLLDSAPVRQLAVLDEDVPVVFYFSGDAETNRDIAIRAALVACKLGLGCAGRARMERWPVRPGTFSGEISPMSDADRPPPRSPRFTVVQLLLAVMFSALAGVGRRHAPDFGLVRSHSVLMVVVCA